MREFPQLQFGVVQKFRQSATTSSFLVKSHDGEDDPMVLKLFTGSSARVALQDFENDLCWQKGLEHPHLMGISSAGVCGRGSFYTTRRFSKDSLDFSNITPTHIRQLFNGIRFLHAHGRPHGRIKPSNLYMVDGDVRLADLRLMNDDAQSDPESIRFAAPEVLAGKAPTIESDYYSLGAVLYRMFARRDPFDDLHLETLKAKYLQVKIPSLRNVGGLRESTANAIDGLLHRNPHRRTTAFGDLIREFPTVPGPVQRAPMVGRHDTMKLLHSMISSRTAQALSVTLIEGDAGIGKTRLVEELQFKSGMRDVPIYTSVCSHRNERSLVPILELLRPVLHRQCRLRQIGVQECLGSFSGSLAKIFEESSAEQEVGAERPGERFVQALIGWMGTCSRIEPLVLCIEDIESAEPVTLRFLTQVSYRASELNIHLILTCRNPSAIEMLGEMAEVLGGGFTRILLEPISTDASRELIQYLESDHGNQQRILSRAGGNPLWLLEYARNESDLSLAARIHARIREELTDGCLKLIHVLSVFRAPARAELLARAAGVNGEYAASKLIWLRKIGAVRESESGFEMRTDALRSAIESECSARVLRQTHAALYGILKLEGGVSEEHLAKHAFHGGLWSLASVHLTSLAQAAAKRGDNVGSLAFYEDLRKSYRKSNGVLPKEAEAEIAICLAKTGKVKKAESIFQRLLSESNVDEFVRIRLSLLSTGGEVDRTNLDQRLRFLREIVESPRMGQPHRAVLLSKLSGSFVVAGDFTAAVDALKRAQTSLEKIPDNKGLQSTKGAEGFLLMNQGHFRSASEIYRTLQCEAWSVSAAALTNRSFCLEHLGNIRNAAVVQKKALRFATRSGHLVSEFVCLGNLGVFNTKLGNFKEAHGYFGQMRKLAAEIGPAGISFKGVEAEETLIEMMEGRYLHALQHLQTALNSTSLLKRTRLECLILDCETRFSMGDEVTPVQIEGIADEGAWCPSPLYVVQLAIFRSRTETSVPDSLSMLESALATAKSASLLYEMCKIELEMAARLQETDAISSKLHADEAISISKKHGYRPLQARALQLRGLCSRHEKEREHYLHESFKLAFEIGLPETISESAYYLGALQRSTRRFDSAREYLATSTRITSEIADRIPTRFRTAYLSRTWRRDARKLYDECRQERPIQLPFAAPIPAGDHRYFRTLYRISVAAASARTVEEFLLELLPAIGLSRDSVIVMLQSGERTTWHSLRATVTEGLRQRVLSVSGKFREQARFTAGERWIPLRSLQYSGGIYVLVRKRNQMDEDEMEFFTILGTLFSSALDQIHNRSLSRPVVSRHNFHGIVGSSRAIVDLCTRIESIAPSNATILIQGETGTGKELVARAIHKLSPRAGSPFIPIDCGAIPEALMESELFGSKKGSFTGAVADRPGVFESAHHGTLFLDEISNMNIGMQAKLLRAIQEREIRRVGESRTRPIDVRLIAASNANLKQLVADGAFRQDLLFRLNVIDVPIPPLRSRREDIPLLAVHFLNHLNTDQNMAKSFGKEALHPLLAHDFPGNIRELQNAVERAFFMTPGRMISSIPIENVSSDDSIDEARRWLDDLAEGRRNFWTAIHDRYKRRDISREKVVALIDLGLRTTRGNYRNLASLFHIDRREYRRLMDFLRRNNCLLDFRPYRKLESLS